MITNKEQMLKNIVDEIVLESIKFPEVQAQTYYMLLELNLEHEMI